MNGSRILLSTWVTGPCYGLDGEDGGTAFVHAFTGMEHLHSEALISTLHRIENW